MPSFLPHFILQILKRSFQSAIFVSIIFCSAFLNYSEVDAQVLRAFSVRHQENLRGDIIQIGNTMMYDASSSNLSNNSGGSNNNATMAWVDADNTTATAHSSSADLGMPSGSTVLWAGLYWGGLNSSTSQPIKFKTATMANYTTLNASQVDVSNSVTPWAYSAFVDVTSYVIGAGNGTYWAADFNSVLNNSQTGGYGGWAMVVIFSNPDADCRNLCVFDGFVNINTGSSNVTTPITGFRTPATGTVNVALGAIAYEGDGGISGDVFRLNGTNMSDALNPSNNFWNGTISRYGSYFTAKNPNYINQLGIDIDVVSTSTLVANNATSANVTFTTSQDQYFPAIFSMVVNSILAVNAGIDRTICQGDTVHLNPTVNGFAPYQYSWSGPFLSSTNASTPVASPTTTSTYVLNVIDASGCLGYDTVKVFVNPKPIPYIIAYPTTAVCQGDTIRLQAFGGVYYHWSDGSSTSGTQVWAVGTQTLTVTVTNASGCSATTSITVTVRPKPTPIITPSGPLIFCTGGSVTLFASSGMSSYLWFPNGETTSFIVVTQPGSYYVMVTNSYGCSGTSPTVTVVVHSRPTMATITPPGPLDFCQGSTATLDAGDGYATYQWSNGSSSRYIIVNQTGNYSVIVGNEFGCVTGSNVVVVTVHPAPNPIIVPPGPITFCTGGSVTLLATTATSTPVISYLWNTGETTPSITVTESGTYRCILTNPYGCTSASQPVQVTVIVPPVPLISPFPLNAIACEGQGVQLYANPSGVNYSWSNGSNQQVITATTTGTYTVTVYNVVGCNATTSIYVQIIPIPKIHILGDLYACSNVTSAFMVPDFVGNTVDNTFFWSVNGGSVLTGQGSKNITVQWGNFILSGTVTCDITISTTGCHTSTTQTVNISPVIPPLILGSQSFCKGTSTVLKLSDNYSSYLWLPNGETSATITVSTSGNYSIKVIDSHGCTTTAGPFNVQEVPYPQPSIAIEGRPQTTNVVICAGDNLVFNCLTTASLSVIKWTSGETTQKIKISKSGDYKVYVTDYAGCTGESIIVHVTVEPAPNANITGPQAACPGEMSSYMIPVTGGTVTWVVTDPAEIQSGQGTPNLNMKWTSNGTKTIKVTAKSDNGCSSTSTITVDVSSTLKPTILAPDGTSFCEGGSITLHAGSGYASYLWTTGETSESITVTGPGKIGVTVTTASGCSGSGSINITLNRINPLVIQSANGKFEVCEGGKVSLNVNNSYSTYEWSNGSTSATLDIFQTTTLTLKVFDINGCSTTNSVTVTVNPLPKPSIQGAQSACLNTTVSYTEISTNAQYSWSVVNGNITSGLGTNSINVFWTKKGTNGNVSITVTDLKTGCVSTQTIYVDVSDSLKPVIQSYSNTKYLCAGDIMTLKLDAKYLNVQWVNDGSTNASLTVSKGGIYTVKVSDGSCSGSATFEVILVTRPTISITANNALVLCSGNSVTLSANLQDSYLWSPNGEKTSSINVSTSGTYSVLVTNQYGCTTASSVITVKINPLPIPSITQAGYTLQTTQPFITYKWYSSPDSTNPPAYTGSTSQTYSQSEHAWFYVDVIDSNGCSARTQKFEFIPGGAAKVKVDTGSVKVAEHIKLPMRLISSPTSLISNKITKFKATLRFNSALLAPTDYPCTFTPTADTCEIVVTGNFPTPFPADGKLGEIDFMGLLGNTDKTVVRIVKFDWLDAGDNVVKVALDTIHGAVKILGIDTNGGPRFYNNTGLTSIHIIEPNPAENAGRIIYEVSEDGMTELYIVDYIGKRLWTLVHQSIKPGIYTLDFDATGLSSGAYFCILQTQSQRKVYPFQILK